jgi:nucleoside-diphosphate-sugar epimerase
MIRFLVTSANGYIGLHIVNQLLKCGYFVRAIVRNLSDEKNLKYLKRLLKFDLNQLEFAEADFLDPHSWINVVENIDFIIHSTQPFPLERFSDSEGLI